MAHNFFDLAQILPELRHVVRESANEESLLENVKFLAERFIVNHSGTFPEVVPEHSEQRFGSKLLHQEDDNTLFIVAVTWPPGGSAPPHNHGTWAVVAGVSGCETNTYWKRTDNATSEGYAELQRMGDILVRPGEVITMRRETIHSVYNSGTERALSLHIYGKNLNDTGRLKFEPQTRKCERFDVCFR